LLRLLINKLSFITARIQQRYTENIDAYQSYLKGRYLMNLAAEDALKAVNSFGEAIQKDPKFVLAYAGSAVVVTSDPFIDCQ
jgi:hypothetical protein